MHESMKPSFDELVIKFRRMVLKVKKVLVSRLSDSLLELKEHIAGLCPHLREKINLFKTPVEVIDFIQDRCTFASFPELEGVIEDFQITEAKLLLSAYKKDLDGLYNKLDITFWLNNSLAVTKTPLTLPLEKAVFTLKWDPENYTMKDIQVLLQQSFTKKHSSWISVQIIKPSNSIVVVCSFPSHLLNTLISKAKKNIEAIKLMKVQKLKIGHSIILQEDVR